MNVLEEELLFDASSLIYALKLKRIDVLYKNYTQYLAIYEILNAIWKETYLVKSISFKEAKNFIEIFIETLNYLKTLSLHPYEADILMKSIELGLTTYDTSYIVLAQKNKLTLATEDRKLRKIAEKHVKTVSVEEIVKQLQ